MLLRTSALFCAVVFVGCSAGAAPRSDGGVTRPDAGPAEPTARLVAESSVPVQALFGATSEVRVRYEQLDGTPVPAAELLFVLEGTTRGSSLSATTAVTDARGRAGLQLQAGRMAATFRVRVTAPGATPLRLDVSVADVGFGTLLVQTSYGGQRPIVRRVVGVTAGRSCAEVATVSAERELDQPVPEPARFIVLPAGVSYAVSVRGLGADGRLLGRGCRDGVDVVVGSDATTSVVLVDAEPLAEGTYDATVSVRGDSAARRLEETLRAACALPVASSGGDAAYLLDAVGAQLRAQGASVEDMALQLRRRTEGLDGRLAARLETAQTGPTKYASAVAADAAAGGGSLVFDATLTLGSGGTVSLALTGLQTAARGPDVPAVPLTVDLSRAPILLTASWAPAAQSLDVRGFELGLGLGTIAQSLLAARRAALLAETSVAGCNELVRFARDQTIAGCDETCARAACTRAQVGVLDAASAGAVALDVLAGGLSIRGTIPGRDLDGDGLVDRFADATLQSAWTNATGLASDDALVEFRAMRR